MKRIIALTTMLSIALVAGPTKPNIPTYHPADSIYLMELDRQTGTLVVNDDDGKYLGTIDPEGKLKLAPNTKQSTFFLGLVNALRTGTPKDEKAEYQLQQCRSVLDQVFEQLQDSPPAPVSDKGASRI